MNTLNESLGNYVSHITEKDGIYIHAENADVRIRVWSAHIIQIHISNKEEADRFSYAVIGKPKATQFTVTEDKKYIKLKTKEIELRIFRSAIRFAFLDKKGRLINKDDDAFGTSWMGNEITSYKTLQEGERFIGLGEKTRSLDKRGQAFVNWNTDAFAYDSGTDPLYTSTPFYIGLHSGLAYGIFLDNSHKSKFNFGASNNRFAFFSAEDGDMNYYFIHHNKVEDIVKSYTDLTGRIELPPMWSLGYQQCRYSYYPDYEVEELASAFRDRKIPCDVIYLDIHYMDKYKLFSWDKNRFPKPKAMINKLKKAGFHVVVIVDPGIKIEKGYKAYDDGVKQDVFVKYPDKSYYSANVWPGECHFPDFTNPKSRDWWKKQIKHLTDAGIEGIWNDMNEIASWGQDTPDLIEFDMEGNRSSHKKAHNVYGMQMARATKESLDENVKEKRSFVLSRAGYSGVQRYAAIWTGDNTSNDDSMMVGVRMVCGLAMAGIPFSGFDVGGFVGDASSKLYQRWISVGAFTPFYRGHTMINTKRSEPWTYGEETEEVATNYIRLRYRLLPYIYSLFQQAAEEGTPICRSLVLDYPHDDKIYDGRFQNQFKFGEALLVCPVGSETSLEKIYLPKGRWYDFYNDAKFGGSQEHIVETPGHRLPVFVEESSIICMQSQTQHAADQHDGVLSIHLYKGSRSNTVSYYEDDGTTKEYAHGKHLKRSIEFNPKDRSLTFTKAVGSFQSAYTSVRLYFHGFNKLKQVTVNKKKLKVERSRFRFIEPTSNFDPFFDNADRSLDIDDLQSVEFRNLKSIVEVVYKD